MRTFLLVILLLASILYAFTTYFDVNSQHLKDGTYRVQVVNKMNGNVYMLMGD